MPAATDRDRWTGITSVWQQDVGGCEMLQEPYLLDHASPAAAAIQTNCVNRGCSLLLT